MWAWLLAQVQLYNETQKKLREDTDTSKDKESDTEFRVNTIGSGRGGMPSLYKVKRTKKKKRR